MSTTAHAWTVNTHATTQKSIPRRMRRIVPGSSHNMPSVVRKKKPVIQIYEVPIPFWLLISYINEEERYNMGLLLHIQQSHLHYVGCVGKVIIFLDPFQQRLLLLFSLNSFRKHSI